MKRREITPAQSVVTAHVALVFPEEILQRPVTLLELKLNVKKQQCILKMYTIYVQLKLEVYIHQSQIHLYSVFHNS